MQLHIQELNRQLTEQNARITEQNERITNQFAQLLQRLAPPTPSTSENTILTPGETPRASTAAPTFPPEKAPPHMKSMYRKLQKEYEAKKAWKESKDAEATSKISFNSSVNSYSEIYLGSGSEAHIIKDQHIFDELRPYHRVFTDASGTNSLRKEWAQFTSIHFTKSSLKTSTIVLDLNGLYST